MLHKSAQSHSVPEEHPVLFTMKMIADRAEVLFNAMTEKGVELPTPAQSRVLMYLRSRKGGPVSQRELDTTSVSPTPRPKGWCSAWKRRAWFALPLTVRTAE